MHKQLISFAQVIKFLENMNLKGGLTPKPPLAYALASACYYTAADLCSMVYETYGIALLLHCCDRFAWQCIRLQ